MPLIGGRDLHSPVAELRVATRDLEAERANGVEKTARIARLEAELAAANSLAAQLAADRDGAGRVFAAEREAWLQQKVALQAGKTALEGELAETRARLSAATNLRAQRDSQIAQLRAEIEDGRQQFDVQRKAIVSLEGSNLDLSSQLEEAAREHERLRGHATRLESEAAAAQEHAIEITHAIAPLVEELNEVRRSLAVEREAAAQDKAMLEAEIGKLTARITEADVWAAALEARIAASPAARVTALWRRITTRCAALFGSDRVPNYAEGTPAKGFEGLSDSKIRVPRGPRSPRLDEARLCRLSTATSKISEQVAPKVQ
jgi:chromosome segregation ATPase